MPVTTPIYGFSYPCADETVSFTDFQTLALQIDTKLASIQLDENYALGRYSSITDPADQAGIVAGVDTVLVNAGSQYVVPESGVYWVSARAFVTIAANLASSRLRVRLNGVPMFGRTKNMAPPTVLSDPMIAVGAVNAAAGDTISQSLLFFGTGPGTAINQRLHVRMLVRTF